MTTESIAPGDPRWTDEDAAARTATTSMAAALPSDLPPVERLPHPPGGFLYGGLSAGIKQSGRPDLAVVRSLDGPAATAAVFTANAFAAAPVRLSRRHLAATAAAAGEQGPGSAEGGFGWVDGLISTSGSANAATGAAGDADQAEIAAMLAAAIGTVPERTLAMSTGIIGTRLPLDRVRAGLERLVPGLSPDATGLAAAAEAIRTTDSRPKTATTALELPGPDGVNVTVRVTGIAKGVGMIHPRMATMLAILTTDATAAPATLHALLRGAATRTWNQLTVDGDTSTNDTVFLLASRAAGAAPVEPGSPAAAALGRAVEAVARDLARQQAADGEGATTLLTCQVSGARDDVEARSVARAVVASSLVKAAIHGRDPNWGRIARAAGGARVADAHVLVAAGLPESEAAARSGSAAIVDPDRLRIAIAGYLVYDGPSGGPVSLDKGTISAAMAGDEVLVRLDLGLGRGSGEAFGCDLTEEYVVENSEYTT
jgi:glutamate N-acetyltransferase / amino-acid N-acetyltransferase